VTKDKCRKVLGACEEMFRYCEFLCIWKFLIHRLTEPVCSKMNLLSCFSTKLGLVITTLSWPESKVTKLGKFGTERKQKMIKIMEQLFNEMQQLADQALYTFSNLETIKFMIESAEEKCSLYYL